jgi:hypothetical protein
MTKKIIQNFGQLVIYTNKKSAFELRVGTDKKDDLDCPRADW